MKTLKNSVTGLGLLFFGTSAHAATGILVVLEKGMQVFWAGVAAAMAFAVGFGIFKTVSGVLLLGKMKEQQNDPELGKKLSVTWLQAFAGIGLPVIVVLIVISLFGGTEVLNFVANLFAGSDGVGDVVDLSTGNALGGGTGTGN